MPAEFVQAQTRVSVAETACARGLPGLASILAALISMHQNHRGNNHHASCHKTKWIEFVPEPPENENIPKPYGYRGQNDNEKGTIHSDDRVAHASACVL